MHRIQLALGDATKIVNGETLTVERTRVSGHTHTWTIQRAASACA
jgi:hypothetical protein